MGLSIPSRNTFDSRNSIDSKATDKYLLSWVISYAFNSDNGIIALSYVRMGSNQCHSAVLWWLYPSVILFASSITLLVLRSSGKEYFITWHIPIMVVAIARSEISSSTRAYDFANISRAFRTREAEDPSLIKNPSAIMVLPNESS